MPKRRRALGVLAIVVLVTLGLASRRPGMPIVVGLYAGDVLWGALFFVLYACLRPRARGFVIWTWAVATTELIELSQLYQARWILRVRATGVGGLLLGHGFLWSDVVCVVLGASIVALVDVCYRKCLLAVTGRARPR